MKKKLITLFLAVVCALSLPFAFAGCKKNGDILKINEVTHSVFYAPMYLAEALGYYEEEGIGIELTNGGGADTTMAAVLSGGADIGFCGPEAAIYVAIGGSNDQPKVFGQLTKRDGSFLVGRKPEPNFKWTDLAGKDVLAGRPGGVPLMTFEYVLRNEGVTTANLITNVAFNSMTAAFEGNVGDYVTMFEPTASEFEKAGKGYIVASVGEQSGAIPYTCFIAKQSYINKNGEKLEKFLRAITKATKYLLATDSATVAPLLAPYFDGTSIESITTSLNSYKAIDAWVTNMAMEESAFTTLQDVIEQAGELERRVAFSDLVLTETAQKVYNEVYA
ncbi:MAG: ABC transporter substrate-binding protein [Clostridia bacterium]|nr:ABC transporter substrate-binding protein [Clostridia bacterium]